MVNGWVRGRNSGGGGAGGGLSVVTLTTAPASAPPDANLTSTVPSPERTWPPPAVVVPLPGLPRRPVQRLPPEGLAGWRSDPDEVHAVTSISAATTTVTSFISTCRGGRRIGPAKTGRGH